jgi:hypothetical protein
MIQNIITELSEVWTWMIGVVAGLGVVGLIGVAGFVILYLKLNKLQRTIDHVNNNAVTSDRDLSIRLRKLEK